MLNWLMGKGSGIEEFPIKALKHRLLNNRDKYATFYLSKVRRDAYLELLGHTSEEDPFVKALDNIVIAEANQKIEVMKSEVRWLRDIYKNNLDNPNPSKLMDQENKIIERTKAFLSNKPNS